MFAKNVVALPPRVTGAFAVSVSRPRFALGRKVTPTFATSLELFLP